MPDAASLNLLAADVMACATACAHRLLIGIAGIAGAGKSTFAAALVSRINAQQGDIARLIPMDGFHFTNEQLQSKDLRNRKGAPETFDAEAYLALLRKVCSDDDSAIPFPIYDRTLHEPCLTGDYSHCISTATRIVITEGNYLLLASSPWSALASILHESWLLKTSVDQAKARLIARHIQGGKTLGQAQSHYDRTDGPNTQRILHDSRLPDRVIEM